jgi:hypothetical protein
VSEFMMQIDEALQYLFTSRVRLKILELFVLNPGERFYVRQIVRTVDEEINAVRRELKRLHKIGLLRSENRVNRRYYQVKQDFRYYPELIRMLGKASGLGGAIVSNQSNLGNIKYAILSLELLLGRVAKPHEVDLMVVGEVNAELMQQLVKDAQQQYGHEINYTTMGVEEFKFRMQRRDQFIVQILTQPFVVLIGKEEELWI